MSDPAGGPPSAPEVSDVAVVVPVRNGEATMADAVASVLAQKFDGTLEVCIAVGPSDDRTREVADGLADADRRVLVVDNPAGVTPAGLNAAIRATSAPIVARVDGHAVLPDGYLARAVDVLDRTGAVNVGGVQEPRGQTPFEEAVGRAMASRFGSGDARYRHGGPAGVVDTVYLGVFRRTALEAIGLFDEALVRNQDYELNWRLREAGGTVWFDPDLRVGYRPRGTLGGLARQYFDYGRWKRVVVRRHPRSLRWRQVVPPLATLGVAVGLVAGIWWLPALVVPAVYLTAMVSASLVVGRHPAAVLRLLSVYPTLHLSWGVGFLAGPPRDVGRRAAGQDAS